MPVVVPTDHDLEVAYGTLGAVVRRTPILESAALNAVAGARVLVKAESLQVTGSFKIRGAYHRLTRLDAGQRRSGVIAFSSGNFAQGLAAAGALLRVPVTIVMPIDAPPAKIEATRGYGADVMLSDHGELNREVVAADLASTTASQRKMVLLHPFDDPHIVAGQASVGREMLEQANDLGCSLDVLVAPVGGGGLIAGCVLAARRAGKGIAIYAVEPEGYDDMARSLRTGERQRNVSSPPTLCDALQAAMPGEVTFAAARESLAGGIAVSDAEVRTAMQSAFRDLKIVLEPSGAAALAAVLAGKVDVRGKCVGVVASGGNIALENFTRIVS